MKNKITHYEAQAAFENAWDHLKAVRAALDTLDFLPKVSGRIRVVQDCLVTLENYIHTSRRTPK